MGRLPIAQMVLVVYCIICGFSLEIINDIEPINKNTWTSYVKLGDYYGPAVTWEKNNQQQLGTFLLYRAFKIFLQEGEVRRDGVWRGFRKSQAGPR